MQLIGLTGGIGSGKSTIARRLSERGAVVVDADQLARDAVAVGTPGLEAVAKQFGDALIAADGSLDRAALGRIIFADSAARRRLNAIVHPAVRELSQRRFRAAAEADPDAIVVYDVPLLAEARAREEFDLIIVASAPADIRIDRLQQLRAMAPEEARNRVAAQASEAERLSIADVVIDTGGTLEHTLEQADALWERLRPP